MEKQNNNKVVIAVLSTIIVILTVLCVLFATNIISINDNKENNNQNDTNQENNNQENLNIPVKSVYDIDCENSETTYNGITVKLEQENDDMMCSTKSFTINGKEIKDKLPTLWVTSYTIYDNNIIILSGDTSGTLLTIYSVSNDSVIMKLLPENLEGYWVKSYSINNNKILLEGKECGMQCGNNETGYSKATFEIEYSNKSFSNPKLVDRFN